MVAMKCSLFLFLPLGLHMGLVASQVLSTTTATETTTTAPASSTTDAFAEATGDICGFLEDDSTLTCASGSCAYISRYSWDRAYAACCAQDGCIPTTTCIERGTAADDATLVCTGSLSRCATWTWPDYNADSYFCTTADLTLTVETTSSTTLSTQSEGAEPTDLEGGAPGGGNTDDNGPALGSEFDLSGKQRVNAAAGSAVFGAVLVGTALIFGCFLVPGAAEDHDEVNEPETMATTTPQVVLYQGLFREEQVGQQWNASEGHKPDTPTMKYSPAEGSSPYVQIETGPTRHN